MKNAEKYDILCKKAKSLCANSTMTSLDKIRYISHNVYLISCEIKLMRENNENEYIKKLIEDSKMREILQEIVSGDEIKFLSLNKKINTGMQKCLLHDVMNYIEGNCDEKNIIRLVCLTEYIFRHNKNIVIHGVLVCNVSDNLILQLKEIIKNYEKPDKFYFDINKITENKKIIEMFRKFETSSC